MEQALSILPDFYQWTTRAIDCCLTITVSLIDNSFTHHASLNISQTFGSRVRSPSIAMSFGPGNTYLQC